MSNKNRNAGNGGAGGNSGAQVKIPPGGSTDALKQEPPVLPDNGVSNGADPEAERLRLDAEAEADRVKAEAEKERLAAAKNGVQVLVLRDSHFGAVGEITKISKDHLDAAEADGAVCSHPSSIKAGKAALAEKEA